MIEIFLNLSATNKYALSQHAEVSIFHYYGGIVVIAVRALAFFHFRLTEK